MLFANSEDGKKIFSGKFTSSKMLKDSIGKVFFCPVCKGRVIPYSQHEQTRNGTRVTVPTHFKHEANSNCPIAQAHRHGQSIEHQFILAHLLEQLANSNLEHFNKKFQFTSNLAFPNMALRPDISILHEGGGCRGFQEVQTSKRSDDFLIDKINALFGEDERVKRVDYIFPRGNLQASFLMDVGSAYEFDLAMDECLIDKNGIVKRIPSSVNYVKRKEFAGLEHGFPSFKETEVGSDHYAEILEQILRGVRTRKTFIKTTSPEFAQKDDSIIYTSSSTKPFPDESSSYRDFSARCDRINSEPEFDYSLLNPYYENLEARIQLACKSTDIKNTEISENLHIVTKDVAASAGSQNRALISQGVELATPRLIDDGYYEFNIGDVVAHRDSSQESYYWEGVIKKWHATNSALCWVDWKQRAGLRLDNGIVLQQTTITAQIADLRKLSTSPQRYS
jgi:hypothetical protein